jgi:creatinine amidohydrolase
VARPIAEWGALTRSQVSDRFTAGALAALAVGALEQHGEHLPTDTDNFLAGAVLREAVARTKADVVVLPAVPFGFSPYHKRFGGTIALRSETYLALMRDVCTSVRDAGARTLVIVNGHGGNMGPLRIVSQENSIDGFTAIAASYWDLASPGARAAFATDGGQFGHAGQFETSLSLALRDGVVGEPSSAFEPARQLAASVTRDLLGDSGVIGDPRAAEAGLGRAFFDDAVEGLAGLLAELAPVT